MQPHFILFCTFISIIEESISRAPPEFNGVKHHPRRKSDLFLAQKSISGVDGFVPEDVIPDRDDMFNDLGPTFQIPGLRTLVLGGMYPEDSLEIPGRDKDDDDKGQANANMRGRSMISSILDPIRHVIFGNTKSNDTTVAESSDASYVKQLIACQRKLILCSLAAVYNVECYLHCLLEAHPVGKEVVKAVSSALKSLCEPLGTVLDSGVPIFNKHFGDVKTLKNYLALFRIGATSYKRYARSAVNALPTILMKYSDLNETPLLKTVINGLETAVKTANKGFSDSGGWSNPGCPQIDSVDAVQQIVDAFYRNPKVIDVITSGFWTTTKIFHLLPNSKRESLQAFQGALDLLTGVECGLVYFGIQGEKQECERKMDWASTIKGRTLPAIKGIPTVCGAVPNFPTDIFDDLFPDIFYKKDLKPAVKEEKSDDGKELGGRSNTPLRDFTWVDQVLKTFDKDY